MGQRSSRPIFDFRDINICPTVVNNVYSPVVVTPGPHIYAEEGVFVDINTGWVNKLSEWGVELVETYENLDEKLYEEWLQEKVNPPPKQISYAVEE